MRQEVGLVGLRVITSGIGFRVGLSLAFGLIAASAALGDGPLFPGAQYTTGDQPISVAIGDLDGDQVPDLAVGKAVSAYVSVLLNQSSGDCNGNGIRDECDIDCGPSGGACDLPGCGQGEDCNGNGEPNDCEADFDLDREALLASSSPACDESLWRSAKNFVLPTFDRNITDPTAGEITIQEIMPGGATGADLSANFTFSVSGNVLRITENVPSLVHRHWYRFTNMGCRVGVANFKRDYVVQVGDASGDGRVLNADVLLVTHSVPCFICGDSRFDIDGDGRVIGADVLGAYHHVPSFRAPKPDGHSCSTVP